MHPDSLDAVCKMWLHARVRFLIQLASACCLVLLVALAGIPARAAEMPGIDLPPGEQVLDLAWRNETTMVLLVQLNNGFALRKLEMASGNLAVISVPREFGYFKPNPQKGTALEFLLSARGNALAVIEPGNGALQAPKLYVYLIDGDTLRAVNTRSIPSEFWVNHAAWDGTGDKLYLTAEPYLFPDQLNSIGVLELKTGEFQGSVIKGNIDLISDLVCLPEQGMLAVRCQAYQGQYPAESLVALVDLAHRTSHILHSRATNLTMHALNSGSLLLFPSTSEKKSGSDYWLLEPGAVTLRRAQMALAGSATTLQTSADGEWFGFLAPAAELTDDGDAKTMLLALQRVKDGKTVVTATATKVFRFAPSGKTVCALAADEPRLYFYQLPLG